MDHQQLIAIANAGNGLKALANINDRFLAHCSLNGDPQGIQTKLVVSGSTLEVASFGHVATASCRFVRDADNDFAGEYVFLVPFQEDLVEVWRCYLLVSGRLSHDVGGTRIICDYNNSYVARHVCGAVVLGLLSSRVFAPLARQGA